MDWCRLTTDYYLDAAILRAGEPAEVLFLRCIAYSGAQETRGRIPKHVLPMLTPKGTAARVKALLAEGLLVDAGDDVVLRSWARIQEAFDSESERRRKAREKKARQRAAAKEMEGTAPGTVPGTPAGQSRGRPRHIEVEVEETPTVSPRDLAFEEFWLVYPRKVGKGQARRAWDRAAKIAEPDAIIAAAVRFARQPGREDQFTPHPTTWLNGERWLDVAPDRAPDPQYAWDV